MNAGPSFSAHCDRCEQLTAYTTGSYFNQEMICPACEKAERAHPQFKAAQDREMEEVKKGNMNYEGIGLPADLRYEAYARKTQGKN